MTQTTLRAWHVRTPGDADALELLSGPLPAPGPQDVRIRVHAAGINRADILQRMGLYAAPPGFDPEVPGLEYAGVVEQAGERVQHRRVGDRVMGLIGGGAYAESVVVHEDETITIPASLSFTDAAALPEDFLTAYRALFLEGGLQPGQWGLVRPATSGVGIAAVQLIHALGGRAIGSSRSAKRLARVRAHGLEAEAVERDSGIADQISHITGGEGVAVILDMLGGGKLADNLECLREEGTQVLVGLLTGPKDEVNLATLLGRRLTLKAMRMRSLPLEGKIRLAKIFQDRLTPLFDSGRLKAVVDTILPFKQAPEAHRRMESNAHCGKIVLEVG